MELPFDQVDFIEERVACFGTTYVPVLPEAQLSIFPEDAALVLQEEYHEEIPAAILASPEKMELVEIVSEEQAEQSQEKIREEDHHSLDDEERFAEDEVVLSACDEE